MFVETMREDHCVLDLFAVRIFEHLDTEWTVLLPCRAPDRQRRDSLPFELLLVL